MGHEFGVDPTGTTTALITGDWISLMLRLLMLRFSSGLDGGRLADSLENCVADSASTGAIQPQLIL